MIRKIIIHPELWQIKALLWPVAHTPPELIYEPFNPWLTLGAEDYLTDPAYPDEAQILNNF